MEERHADFVHQFHDRRVEEVMDSRIWDLPMLSEDEPLNHVFLILSGKNHCWVVKDKKERKLVGVITEKDILQIIAPLRVDKFRLGRVDIKSLSLGTVDSVKSIMSKHPVSCSKKNTIKDALLTMMKYKVRRMPVVEKKRLIGELTLHDIINTYASMVMRIK